MYYQQVHHFHCMQVTSLTNQLEEVTSNEELRGEVGKLNTVNDGLKMQTDGLKISLNAEDDGFNNGRINNLMLRMNI